MASVHKLSNGRWQARYRPVPGGRQVSKTAARKVDVERWLHEQVAAVVTGQYADPRSGRVLFRAYAESWRTIQQHRPATAELTERHLRLHVYPILGDLPLSSIRPSHVQSLVTAMGRPADDGHGRALAPTTIRTVTNIVKAVFHAAVHDRMIARDPSVGVVLPKVPRRRVEPLTVKQVQVLRAALPPEYAAYATVAAGTGMRLGEVLGLQVADVDFLRGLVRVERQVLQDRSGQVQVSPLKTQSSYRTIPVGRTVTDALAAHLAAYPANQDHFIFRARGGGPVVRDTFEHLWRKAAKAAGLKGTGTHRLRHTYASWLLGAGLSVKVVAERLGHANAAITLAVYAHLLPDDEDRSRTAIDAVFRSSPSISDASIGE